MEEYQSQHVPIRSKTSALGLEGLGVIYAIWGIKDFQIFLQLW